jgi:hypothetical protein
MKLSFNAYKTMQIFTHTFNSFKVFLLPRKSNSMGSGIVHAHLLPRRADVRLDPRPNANNLGGGV